MTENLITHLQLNLSLTSHGWQKIWSLSLTATTLFSCKVKSCHSPYMSNRRFGHFHWQLPLYFRLRWNPVTHITWGKEVTNSQITVFYIVICHIYTLTCHSPHMSDRKFICLWVILEKKRYLLYFVLFSNNKKFLFMHRHSFFINKRKIKKKN